MWWLIGIWAGVCAVVIGIGFLASKRKEDFRRMQAVQASKHGWWRWRWSQDGWVRKCKICGAVQYGGDDYEGGPDEGGLVQAG